MRGMGDGGGGEGFGRIHGMGKIDTGGGRGVRAGLGGKEKRKATSRVQRGAGDVQGFCKEADIQRVVLAQPHAGRVAVGHANATAQRHNEPHALALAHTHRL